MVYSAAQTSLFLAVLLLMVSAVLQSVKVVQAGGVCTTIGTAAATTCAGTCGQCAGGGAITVRAMDANVLENSMCGALAPGTARALCDGVEAQSLVLAASMALVLLAAAGAILLHGATLTGVCAALGGAGLLLATVLADPAATKRAQDMGPEDLSLGCGGGVCVANGPSYYLTLAAGVAALVAALPVLNGPLLFAY
jgi:hypothetical protein